MESNCAISFRLSPGTSGWLKIDIAVGSEQINLTVSSSEIGSRAAGVAELILAVAAFCTLETSQSVMFETEGTQPILRLDRVSGHWNDLMRIRIGYPNDLMVGQSDIGEDVDVFFDATCPISDFLGAFSSAVTKLFAERSIEAYNRQWLGVPSSYTDLKKLLPELTIEQYNQDWSGPYTSPSMVMHEQYLRLLDEATSRYLDEDH